MRSPLRAVAFVLVFFALCSQAAEAQPRRSPAPGGGVAVLDNNSYWRMFHTLKAPVVDADGRLVPYLRKVAWLDSPTPEPPPGWADPNFDDTGWLRTPAHGGCQTPYLARQCLRGKFQVNDPARVKGLTLSLEYHGGVVAYLNGKELTRRNLPAGPIGESTLAEAYSLEVYVTASGDLIADDGTYIASGRKSGRPDADSLERMARRVRKIEEFPLPSSALRNGVNVLAIELIRAPYHKVMLEGADQSRGRNRRNTYDWYTCEVLSVRLAAAGAEGLVPNTGRPAGWQVWNSDLMAADGDLDYGDRCEPLRPIEIVAARNGWFSGKVVVGSPQPITGLRATAGELTGPGGAIPASAVRVRYGYHWGMEDGFTRGEGSVLSPYPQWPGFFGGIVDSPPAEIPVSQPRPPLAAGAVMPIWLTVKVPKDAKPGQYSGELRIEASGQKPVTAQVHLEVTGWTLSDPQDYRTWVELIEVPDTLSLEYDLPLGSDKLLEMAGRSFQLMSNTGSRVVYVPAIAHTNLGNEQSMIRWVQKGPNRYEWDFSVMDKYLDEAQKNLGTPKIVVLQVWELYMSTAFGKRFTDKAAMGVPLVTMLDRATGKTQNEPLPSLADPASKAIWQGLITEVRKRLRPRGLEKALMLGMFTDATPPKADMEFFHRIAPDLPWVQEGHGRWTKKVYDIAEVGYQATVWGGYRFGDGLRQTNQQKPPIVESLHGWAEPRLDVVFERNTDLDSYPASRWRFFPETGITSELRGIGRIGADYWKAVKDRQGRRVGWAHDRFQEGSWGGSSIALNLCNPALAPGPDGPIATNRLLALAEGVQEAEARIVLERALLNAGARARLGAELAKRCQTVLDERLWTMWRTLCNYQLGGPFFFGAGAWRWTAGVCGHRWYLSTGWQQSSRELFTLAAQVQQKLGK